jgi:LysM repeat protein
MSPDTSSKPTKLCPTCGTRVSEDAVRCLVCGSELTGSDKPPTPSKSLERGRMPEVTLSLPVALVLLSIFLLVGAGIVYFALPRTKATVAVITSTPTITITVTPSLTPTAELPTATFTPNPTPTPISYTIKSGDYCATIAYNFGVSIQSIVLLNNLPSDCGLLVVGNTLLIPQATPTSTPLPTATLSSAERTEVACGQDSYIVQENDTLSTISAKYGVPMAVIREYNGMSSDTVIMGQPLIIPLCKRFATPGPTPTVTPPPPYAAPNLLLPSDGADLTQGNQTVTLQWASVGALAQNESYLVTVIDLTAGGDQKLVDYVTDTKYIVPETFRPTGNTPHAFRWWVTTVRQTGTDENGQPIWTSSGASSDQRVFIWIGLSAIPTPTQ